MAELLDSFLRKRKKDENTISKSLAKELLSVESEIQKRQKTLTDAKEALSNNAINIKSISDSTGISRKTFYNNELLSAFVKEYSTKSQDTNNDDIDKLKQKLADCENKINQFLNKDIDYVQLNHEVAKLQSELEISNKRVKVLEEQLEKALKKQDQKDNPFNNYRPS